MYTRLYPNLFKPLKIRGMTVKNRIMSPPNMLFHTVDGRPTDYYIRYIEHKARGGAGIVTLGEACVCDGGNHTPWMEPTLDNLPLYGEIAATVHEHNAVASVELTHGGVRVKPQYNKTDRLIGPVDMVNDHGAHINAMTVEDMEHVADAFADVAEYYFTAGFDTVLLHMAHGWLFTQFFSPIINTRADEYGGSFENRMRFPMMVIRRVRERVGESRPLLLRLSGSERCEGGFTVEDIITFLESAQDYVDMAEISVEELTNFFASTYMPWGQNLDLAESIKSSGRVHIPIFTIGSIMTPRQAEDIIESGKADGVSMSRALIADPFLPKKAMGAHPDEITPCLRCLNCTDSDNMTRHFVCSVNPLISREERLGFADTMTLANFKKKLLVVGGGPAGMQAAITASRRGHEVVLCERSDALGGLLKFTDTDSLKHDLRRFKDYLVRGIKNHNVKVLLNTEVNDTLVDIIRPDHIIVATGSIPIVPKRIKGIEFAHHCLDVYFNPAKVSGEEYVIIGGGLVGVETGLHLLNTGKRVTVIEMLDDYAKDAKTVYRFGLERQIRERGLRIITGAVCREVTGSGVVYEKDGAEVTVSSDVVLYAVGQRSNDAPYFGMYDSAPIVDQVGDCKRVGKVDGAIHSAYFAALGVGMV